MKRRSVSQVDPVCVLRCAASKVSLQLEAKGARFQTCLVENERVYDRVVIVESEIDWWVNALVLGVYQFR